MSTPYDIARAEGYTDQEINDFLATKSNNLEPQNQEIMPSQQPSQNEESKYKTALDEGYSKEEIDKYLQSKKPALQRYAQTAYEGVNKALRLPGQYAIGAFQRLPGVVAYDVAVAPLASKEAQHAEYRKNIFEDIERLYELKQVGAFDEQDQQLLDSLLEQIKSPEKAEKFVKTIDLTTGGLAEKAGLAPKGTLEKAARWSGFIKNPQQIAELGKAGLKPKELFNFFKPTVREGTRGLGAGVALEIAEVGDFGPLGTMTAAILGDIIGGGAVGAAKAIGRAAITPTKTAGKIGAFFTPNSKLQTQAEVIRKAREQGITLDIGSITDSKTLKFIQSTLAASGLTGKALDDLRSQLTSDVVNSYKRVADGVGQIKFNSLHDAGETFINVASKLRKDARAANQVKYQAFENALTSADATNPTPILSEIQKVQNKLKPGSFKSDPQKKVLGILEEILPDLMDAEGQIKPAKIKDLWNVKKALQDEIDYDTVGGLDKLLNPVLKEIDKALIGYGASNPKIKGLLTEANRIHSQNVKTFQEGTVGKFLKRGQNPDKILNSMDSTKGIREIKKALINSPEGREVWDGLRRAKLDQVIGDNMIDSTTQQLKTGTFSKLLEKGKNREVIRELVGPEAYKKLEDLQYVSGRLAESSQKFLNASQSGTKGGDLLLGAEILRGTWSAIGGNAYPLARTGTLVTSGYALSKLLGNKKFLTAVEDAVLERSNDPRILNSKAKRLTDFVKEYSKENPSTVSAGVSASLR